PLETTTGRRQPQPRKTYGQRNTTVPSFSWPHLLTRLVLVLHQSLRWVGTYSIPFPSAASSMARFVYWIGRANRISIPSYSVVESRSTWRSTCCSVRGRMSEDCR